MQGKPYAGNPHVRFDEGAGAPRHSGRSALLYITSNKTRAEKHDQATGNLENLYSACNLFLHGV